MKQSAAKTLGVAALGAAFAAVAAGSASAAVPAVGLTDALGTATTAVQGLTSQQQVSPQGQEASDPGQALGAVTGLLGGLPTSGLGA
ncbi:hypothetical protein [Streptomyces sp. NPDC060031]|uniref:hypothetical protein n=1 Tax=Streptomyces sp. NPDC060031 TaxID=3347043 RepID=UPI003695C1F1